MPIVFIHSCECGKEAECRTFDLTQGSGAIRLDFALACSQLELECPHCGRKYYTGDIEVLSENEI